MKKNIIFAILFFLFISIIFLVSFLFFSKPLQVENNNIKMIKEKGKISVKYDNSDFYEEIFKETILHTGDEIKTGSDSKAIIIFFENEEVVLDENTELLINRVILDKNSPFLTKVSLKLKTGQIWNRLQSFFNPEAMFEVEAEDVVATVRGTVFNVLNKDQKIEVSVFENNVDVVRKNDFSDFSSNIKENNKIIFLINDYKVQNQEEISQNYRDSDWVKENLEQDSDFKERLKKYNQNILEKNNLNLNDNLFSNLGEKIRLFFTFDRYKKELLKSNFEIKRDFINRSREDINEKIETDDYLSEQESHSPEQDDNLFEQNNNEKIETDDYLSEQDNILFEQDEYLSEQENENKDDLINLLDNEFQGDISIQDQNQEEEIVLEKQRIEITVEKKVLTVGDETNLNVFFYNDDEIKNITNIVKFVVEPDSLTQVYAGTMRENIFITNQNGGLALIKVNYFDDSNIEYNDEIILTVLTY